MNSSDIASSFIAYTIFGINVMSIVFLCYLTRRKLNTKKYTEIDPT